MNETIYLDVLLPMGESSSIQGPGASPPLTDFERAVVDVFIQLADMAGIQKSVAEIYGLLFASATPLSLQDLVDRLGISKGSASQGLRMLRSTGAAKLIYVAGTRRDHFIPETELRAVLSGFLRERVRPHLEGILARAKHLDTFSHAASFGGGDLQTTQLLQKRIDKLQAWHRRGKTVLPIISKLFG